MPRLARVTVGGRAIGVTRRERQPERPQGTPLVLGTVVGHRPAAQQVRAAVRERGIRSRRVRR